MTLPADVLVIRRRTLLCGVCERPIEVDSVTNEDPECPEMLSPALVYASTPAASLWWGLLRDSEADGSPSLLVLCSQDCLRKLVML